MTDPAAIDEQPLRDAADHAAHILKAAQPGAMITSIIQAHDLLYNAAIKFYAAQSPHIHAQPMKGA